MSNHSIFTAQLEPPTEAPIQPACELLVQALKNYEKTSTELQEFKGCIALAEADENSALESNTIPEAEVVNRVKEQHPLGSRPTDRVLLEISRLESLRICAEVEPRRRTMHTADKPQGAA